MYTHNLSTKGKRETNMGIYTHIRIINMQHITFIFFLFFHFAECSLKISEHRLYVFPLATTCEILRLLDSCILRVPIHIWYACG